MSTSVKKFYTAFGETKTMREWLADPRCCVRERTFRQRVNVFGWNVEQAITRPSSTVPVTKAKLDYKTACAIRRLYHNSVIQDGRDGKDVVQEIALARGLRMAHVWDVIKLRAWARPR